jgi:hypothetical protein
MTYTGARASKGQSSITVEGTAFFSPGDQVVINGPSATGPSTNVEIVTIASVQEAASSLTLTAKLQQDHAFGEPVKALWNEMTIYAYRDLLFGGIAWQDPSAQRAPSFPMWPRRNPWGGVFMDRGPLVPLPALPVPTTVAVQPRGTTPARAAGAPLLASRAAAAQARAAGKARTPALAARSRVGLVEPTQRRHPAVQTSKAAGDRGHVGPSRVAFASRGRSVAAQPGAAGSRDVPHRAEVPARLDPRIPVRPDGIRPTQTLRGPTAMAMSAAAVRPGWEGPTKGGKGVPPEARSQTNGKATPGARLPERAIAHKAALTGPAGHQMARVGGGAPGPMDRTPNPRGRDHGDSWQFVVSVPEGGGAGGPGSGPDHGGHRRGPGRRKAT